MFGTYRHVHCKLKIAQLVKTARKQDRFIGDLGDDIYDVFWIGFGFFDFGFGHELEKHAKVDWGGLTRSLLDS